MTKTFLETTELIATEGQDESNDSWLLVTVASLCRTAAKLEVRLENDARAHTAAKYIEEDIDFILFQAADKACSTVDIFDITARLAALSSYAKFGSYSDLVKAYGDNVLPEPEVIDAGDYGVPVTKAA